MSRKFMTILLSSALVFGSVSTSAWSATEASGAVQAQSVLSDDRANNQPPLPPSGAAGIKQAQGALENSPWLGIGIVAAIVIIAWILLDDDEEEDDPPSGTN